MVMGDLGYLTLMLVIIQVSPILKVLDCVLLDVDDFSALINYFQSLNDNLTGLYELRRVHVIAEISIQSNATENPLSRQTDTRQSEVIGKAAADDQRNNSNTTNLNTNNTIGIR